MGRTYIMHYGVGHDKGGHSGRYPWGSGSRPYQNRTVLKKGTELSSVKGYYAFESDIFTTDVNKLSKKAIGDGKRWLYTYQKSNDWDRAVYTGPFSQYLANCGMPFIREFQYRTVKDLKMPTKQERYDEFKNLPLKDLQKDLTSFQKYLKRKGSYLGGLDETRERNRTNFKKLGPNSSEETWQIAYKLFNHMMENNQSYKSTKTYSENVAKKWDAMVDDNNADKYNKANDPIIIFDPAKTLAFVDKFADDLVYPKEMGGAEANGLITNIFSKNFNYVKSEMEKIGQRVSL